MAVAVGQRCVVRIQITDIELRNARDIMATIVSPQGEDKCQEVSFDEVSGLVYVSVDVNSVGSWSMWLGVRFAEGLFYTPSFVFAEVEGDAKPCDAPYVVDVEVQGESVTVTPPHIDVDGGDDVSREEFDQLSSKVEDLEEQIGSGSITIDTELSETSNNAVANSAVAKGLKGKQNTLTLTTKPNGNIVIGNIAGQSKEFMPATPSGDPMHYVYLSYYGVTYNEQTNLYTVGYLTDLTADDMRKAFAMYGGGMMSAASNSWISNWEDWNRFQGKLPRTTLPVYSTGNRLYYDKTHLSFCWNDLEQIHLCYVPSEINEYNTIKIWQYNSSEVQFVLNSLKKLKYIVDTLHCNMPYDLNIFKTLPMLTEVRLFGLQGNVSFELTPYLSKESLLYMINNCASGVSFTITLHPDVYAKCTSPDAMSGEWENDVYNAIEDMLNEKDSSITLASA